MQTELSFLLDLLLSEHKLPKAVQQLIKDRVKEVEVRPNNAPLFQRNEDVHTYPIIVNTHSQEKVVDARGQIQSPSMARAIAEMEQGKEGHVITPPTQEVVANAMAPQAAILPANAVASPAAAQALLDRQRMINEAINNSEGKFNKGQSSPMKLGQRK
jgi:hypothetical protein